MRTSMLFAVASVALLLGACGPRPKIDGHALIEVDSDFTPEETERVLAGVALWEAASPDMRFRTASRVDHAWMLAHPGADDVFQLVKVTEKTDPACTVLHTDVADTYYSPGHACFADEPTRVFQPGTLELLVAHEMGHMLGLDHQPTGVMAPSPSGRGPIACSDVQRLGYRCAE